MKNRFVLPFCVLFMACLGQEKVSTKTFEPTTLVNNIRFSDSKYDQPKFSCGFLLKVDQDTFAVTAKHLLKIIKPETMSTLNFKDVVKSWSLYPLNGKEQVVETGKLLNENTAELLEKKSTYNEDWLVFSIKNNQSKIKPLELRSTPLTQGEKLYVIGWTRKMEDGPQRVYEFEYYKTIGNRILLKELIVPEQFGGLSGSPVVDEQGHVIALVSNGTEDPATNKKYFSPCLLDGLKSFLKTQK